MTGAFRGFYSHDTSLVCFGWLAVNEDKSCCFEMGNTARMFLCGQKSVTSVATCALHTAAFIGFALSDVGQIPLSVPLCLPALRCELWRCRGFCSKCVCVHLNPALSLTRAAPCGGTWGLWGSSDLGAWGHSQPLFPVMMLKRNCSSPPHSQHDPSRICLVTLQRIIFIIFPNS